MDPKVWGPSCWLFLEKVVSSYSHSPSDVEKLFIKDFVYKIGDMLPCYSCRSHFKTYIRSNPPDLQSKTTMTVWLNDLHNHVNERLMKGKVGVVTHTNPYRRIMYLSIVFVIIFIAYQNQWNITHLFPMFSYGIDA